MPNFTRRSFFGFCAAAPVTAIIPAEAKPVTNVIAITVDTAELRNKIAQDMRRLLELEGDLPRR